VRAGALNQATLLAGLGSEELAHNGIRPSPRLSLVASPGWRELTTPNALLVSRPVGRRAHRNALLLMVLSSSNDLAVVFHPILRYLLETIIGVERNKSWCRLLSQDGLRQA
jgi:hypothetical protein